MVWDGALRQKEARATGADPMHQVEVCFPSMCANVFGRLESRFINTSGGIIYILNFIYSILSHLFY